MKRVILIIGAAAGPALAQSNVHSGARHAWGENSGWHDWRSAHEGTQGVRRYPGFLAGFIWSEGSGWINLGRAEGAAPCGGYPTGQWGVNIDPDNRLSGFAWGENIGWISFGPWPKGRPNDQRATLNPATGQLAGYAWSENTGWISLSLQAPLSPVRVCFANCDGSGASPALTANDFQCFINAFAMGDPYANCDGSTGSPCLTGNDFVCFINGYALGCQ